MYQFNCVHIGAIVKTSVHLQGVFGKIGDLLNVKGSPTGIPQDKAHPRISRPPEESARQVDFGSLLFHDAPGSHPVLIDSRIFRTICGLGWFLVSLTGPLRLTIQSTIAASIASLFLPSGSG